jgi:hypothetical protein
VNVEAGAASPLDGATVADDGACAAAMTQEQLPRAADLDSRALSLRREIQVHLVVRILLPLSFVYFSSRSTIQCDHMIIPTIQLLPRSFGVLQMLGSRQVLVEMSN